MNCHRVKLDGSGKAAGEPVTFAENKMVGQWAPRAFQASWDGKTVVSYSFEGFRVTRGSETRDYKIQLLHKNLWWSPDNKKFLVWLPAGIALGDVDDLGPPGNAPKTKIIYRPPANRFPFGVSWSPSGQDIFVSEHDDAAKTAIKKVPLAGGAGTEILNHPVEITFYMLPETWYDEGTGPVAKKALIAFGAKDGLWVMDDAGQNKVKISEVAPEGVTDVIWDPTQKEQFLFLMKQPITNPTTKKSMKGLFLAHADKKGEQALELITDSTDLHTVYFSRKGKYICWATSEGISYRETAKQENPTKIVISDASGPVRGFNWDNKESKIAIAIENKLFLYDLASKTATCVVSIPPAEKTFIAEPHWKGDEIIYSTFADTALKRKLDDPKDKDGKAKDAKSNQPDPPKK